MGNAEKDSQSTAMDTLWTGKRTITLPEKKKVHKHTKNVSHFALYTNIYPSGICYQGVCNSLERTDSFAWESHFVTLFVIHKKI